MPVNIQHSDTAERIACLDLQSATLVIVPNNGLRRVKVKDSNTGFVCDDYEHQAIIDLVPFPTRGGHLKEYRLSWIEVDLTATLHPLQGEKEKWTAVVQPRRALIPEDPACVVETQVAKGLQWQPSNFIQFKCYQGLVRHGYPYQPTRLHFGIRFLKEEGTQIGQTQPLGNYEVCLTYRVKAAEAFSLKHTHTHKFIRNEVHPVCKFRVTETLFPLAGLEPFRDGTFPTVEATLPSIDTMQLVGVSMAESANSLEMPAGNANLNAAAGSQPLYMYPHAPQGGIKLKGMFFQICPTKVSPRNSTAFEPCDRQSQGIEFHFDLVTIVAPGYFQSTRFDLNLEAVLKSSKEEFGDYALSLFHESGRWISIHDEQDDGKPLSLCTGLESSPDGSGRAFPLKLHVKMPSSLQGAVKIPSSLPGKGGDWRDFYVSLVVECTVGSQASSSTRSNLTLFYKLPLDPMHQRAVDGKTELDEEITAHNYNSKRQQESGK
ncbi:hypothetical protein T439DRAFT_327178 [Meredithblackwellia eburnea MCA 4105]